MRLIRVPLGVCLVLLFAPGAVTSQDLSQGIVTALPDSSSYAVERDLVYRERDGRTLLLDVFVPVRATESPVPAVVFVHGGPLSESEALQGKDLGQYQSFAPYVTEAGLGAVVFTHGFSDLDAFQAAQGDVEAALAFVRSNAARFGLDRDRICLVNISAGGIFLSPFLEARPSWLRCAVLYYALLRPATFEAWGAEPIAVDQTQGLDPFRHLDSPETAPALFIAEAGGDLPELNEELRRFRDSAVEAGWSVEYWNHPAGPHGFDVLDPSVRSRMIVERTRSFLREQLVSELPRP